MVLNSIFRPIILGMISFTSFCSCNKKQDVQSIPVTPSPSEVISMPPVQDTRYHYLALGDSYTIGQDVKISANFPNQTTAALRKTGVNTAHSDIIAVTGWTTRDLEQAIQEQKPSSDYDIVTLLIGVNDQYQGKSVEEYKPRFKKLLQQAIQFAGGKPDHVVVLSIPDWSVTPYAQGGNTVKISAEIDAFNNANYQISMNFKVHYINITNDTRKMLNDPSLVAAGGLHPSGKEYAIWVEKLVPVIQKILGS